MSTRTSKQRLAEAVLDGHGRTYAEEAGIRLTNTPSALFQLLNLSLLLSARISADNAVEAARALRKAKLTTPQKMAAASWQDRVDVLTAHGYTRYDESASRMLGDTADRLIEQYDGDLRKLREEAEREVETEHELLQQFKGIGNVGADIFLREVQGTWKECHPYADPRVTRAAQRLGLPKDPNALARLTSAARFPRLAAGLVRVDLEKAHDEVKAAAGRTS